MVHLDMRLPIGAIKVVESLLALKSIIYEYCDDVGTSYSYLFDNYYESETFE